LFEQVPENFVTFSSHQDEVHSLPNEFDLLAQSDRCDVQAIRLRNKAAWGIQFHPEKSLSEGISSVESRLRQKKEVLDTGFLAKSFDPMINERIFLNFLAQGQK
jgi:GMP synthase-like glutamine amidotransferase